MPPLLIVDPPVGAAYPPVLGVEAPPLLATAPPVELGVLAASLLTGSPEVPELQPIPTTPKMIAETVRTLSFLDWVRVMDAPCGES
jgi:hypothetical protein